VIENARYATSDSLHSLRLALEHVGDEDIAVFHGDVVYEPDLMARFLRSPRRTALLVDELRDFDEREYRVRVADGLVRDASDRIPANASFGQDAQAFKIAREHIPLVKAYARQEAQSGRTHQYAGRVLAILMEKGLLHPIYTNQQSWSEFDTADDYRRCVDLFAKMEDRPPEYSSYGMNDESPVATPNTDPSTGGRAAVTSPFHYARRLWQCIVRRELPWRVREFLAGWRASPWRAFRCLRPFANGSLSTAGFRLQVYGHELLQAVSSEAGDLGIRPFLLWGTLLGCVRDRGFIANDHDVDMGLLEADFRRVPELKQRLIARGFTIRVETAGKISFQHPRVGGLWVDIDRLVEARDHWWVMSHSEDAVTFAYWFSRESLARLVPTTFDGVPVFVPGGAEDVLATIYGTWRIRQSRKQDWLRAPLNLMLWKQ
jgi:hypothetical protein